VLRSKRSAYDFGVIGNSNRKSGRFVDSFIGASSPASIKESAVGNKVEPLREAALANVALVL
jgi:hypothetical protein